MRKVRFGIIGTGKIAGKFAEEAAFVENCEVIAVASRTLDKATTFAKKHYISKGYMDYKSMLKDSDIDAVYIATPHVNHKRETIAALKAKKAVLCEKSFAMNSTDAAEMIDCARVEDVLLMEAMWIRFLPAIIKMKSLLDEGLIGDVAFVKCDFGFDMGADYSEVDRLLNPELGGGALYDVGIYPVSTLRYIMEKDPIEINCASMPTKTGVDGLSIYQYKYEDGRLAILYSSTCVNTQKELFISGTKGSIHVPLFWMADRLTLTDQNGEMKEFVFPKTGTGYVYEIESFCNSFLQGKKENERMPLAETLAIMKTMDVIRSKIG